MHWGGNKLNNNLYTVTFLDAMCKILKSGFVPHGEHT
jgi:hypothetical protein